MTLTIVSVRLPLAIGPRLRHPIFRIVSPLALPAVSVVGQIAGGVVGHRAAVTVRHTETVSSPLI